MSTPFPPQPPQFQPPAPPAPAKKRGPWITSKPILILAALIIGLAIGNNVAGAAKPAATVTVAGRAGATITQQASPAASAPAVTAQPAPPAGTIKDGTWLVNKDIKPGQYRSDNVSGNCYWERLKDTSGGMDAVIAIEDGSGPMLVTIKPTDAAFKSARCGEWQPV